MEHPTGRFSDNVASPHCEQELRPATTYMLSNCGRPKHGMLQRFLLSSQIGGMPWAYVFSAAV